MYSSKPNELSHFTMSQNRIAVSAQNGIRLPLKAGEMSNGYLIQSVVEK